MKFITTAGIGYICLALVIIFTVRSCNEHSGLSDKAAEAISAACASAKQVPKLRITKSEITAECETPVVIK